MIRIKKISINELPEIVKFSYENDSELFEKYFGLAKNFMGCVNSQLAMIYEMAERKKLSYYKVVFQDKTIGYFVIFDGVLYSFAINIRYRKKDILQKWWQLMKSKLGNKFACYLYEWNERAINFLLKNGMKIYDKDEESKTVALIYER